MDGQANRLANHCPIGWDTEVARICQIKPPSVSEWRVAGIPPARRQYLELLLPDAFGHVPTAKAQVIGALVDSRMSKRLLQLPVELVAAWPAEQDVPALPQLMRILGVQLEQPAGGIAPTDPDAERVIQVQVA